MGEESLGSVWPASAHEWMWALSDRKQPTSDKKPLPRKWKRKKMPRD